MKKLLKCVSVFALAFALMPIVKAATIDEMIAAGEITVKAIPIEDKNERSFLFGNILAEDSYWKDYSLRSDDEDINKVYIRKNGTSEEEKHVKVKYEYDPAVKKVVDGLIAEMDENGEEYQLNDIEAISFLISSMRYLRAHPDSATDNHGYSMEISLADFSSEVRKKIKYNNFKLAVGYGGDTVYGLDRGGQFAFVYDGVYYGSGPMVLVQSTNAVYVPSTTNYASEEATLKAVKDRLSKYFDIDTVEVEMNLPTEKLTLQKYIYDDFVNDYNNKEQSEKDFFASQTPAITNADEFAESEMANIELNDSIYEYVVKVTLKTEEEVRIAVIKNDDGLKDDKTVKTVDVSSGVEVYTDGVIPLDTLIHVARITSGDEYDKIVKLLKITNVDMFDLSLSTSSNNEMITKLDNGKFRVKLPIKDEFKNKELKVYYVDEDDKVEEYAVTISDDGKYAIFETDHFSIYTLAAGEEIKNPKTGDNILLYVATLMLSSIYLLTRKLRKN